MLVRNLTDYLMTLECIHDVIDLTVYMLVTYLTEYLLVINHTVYMLMKPYSVHFCDKLTMYMLMIKLSV